MAPTAVSDERSLRWWQYVGPWPLAPIAVVVMMWLTAGIFEIARLTASASSLHISQYPPIFLKGFPAAAGAWFVLWLFARAQPMARHRSTIYWLAIAATAVTFVGIRWVMGLLPYEGFDSEALKVIAALARTTVMVVFIEMVTGITGYRLGVQVHKTNTALQLVRQQQEQMLEADERMRAQVSTLLHDRVQAGIIAACLELQDAAGRADPSVRREIADVVHRLEDLRGLDVRRAARALSPNLDDTDLHSAIDDLAAQYLPSMRVEIAIVPDVLAHATRPAEQVLLGAYRIVEQSLLNAAIHGRARNCSVAVSREGDRLVVSVDDDGQGMSGTPTSGGLGTALVTTWVRILDGAWVREASPMGGVRVQATLPYAAT